MEKKKMKVLKDALKEYKKKIDDLMASNKEYAESKRCLKWKWRTSN